MKRYIIPFFIFLLMVCGCNQKTPSPTEQDIYTLIEEEQNYLVGINYPITLIPKFDQQLKDYANQEYQNFKKEYGSFQSLSEKSELNIDYTYQIVNNRYYVVTLHTFINSSHLAHPINKLKTFVYDKSSQKSLTLADLISEEELKRITPKLKQLIMKKYKECFLLDELNATITPDFTHYSLFTFNDTTLTLYFNPYEVTAGFCGIISIELPLSELKLKLPIEKDVLEPIEITERPVSKTIDPNKPVIAITFDDGPSRYTKEILTVLKENDANATFFVLGNKAKTLRDTLKRAVEEGNELGNHSYNHKWLSRLTVEELQKQINDTQTIVKEITGYEPLYLRPTYGSVNKKIRNNTKLEIVLWNIDTLDWKIKSKEKIADRAIKEAKDGRIILMHDTYKRTVEALKIIVPKLKEQGYQLVTISELKEVELLRNQMQNAD